MSEAIDLERLMVQLEANSAKLKADFERAESVISTSSDRWEKRLQESRKRMEDSYAAMGTNMAKKFSANLAAGLSLVALEQFFSSTTEIAKTIDTQSKALEISTDKYQEISLAARKARVDQGEFNTALDHFSKTIGDAQLKTSPLAKQLKTLGVDVRSGTVPAFLQFADGIGRIANAGQRAKIVTDVMGRSSQELTGFMLQGAASITAQMNAFKANGEVIEKDQLDKLIRLDKAWVDLKAHLSVASVNVLAGFEDGFDKFAKDMGSQSFQSALNNFGKIMGDVAGHLVKMGPYLPSLAAAIAGRAALGPAGLAVGAGTYVAQHGNDIRATALEDVFIPGLQDKVESAQGRLQNAISAGDSKETIDRYRNALEVEQAELEKLQAEYKRLRPPPNVSEESAPNGAVTYDPADILGQEKLAKIRGPLDMSGTGEDKHAFSDAVRDLITKTRELSAAEDESTLATTKAEAATKLLNAAQEDGRKITPALRSQVEALAGAYAKVAAARAFDKDLAAEDKQIAKLADEARQADMTKAALASLAERQKLTEAFHKEFGDTAVPNAAQQAEIDSRASAFGAVTGEDEFSKSIKSAQDQDESLKDSVATIGLYDGALAAAQMRLQLLDEAAKAFDLTTEKGRADYAAAVTAITALAAAHGKLTQAEIDGQKAEQNRVAVADELRTGLENVAASGLKGFKSMRDAAASFVEELAELILKLYVIEPLLDSLLGKPGTTGGGILGPFLSSLFGSAVQTFGTGPGTPGFSHGPDPVIADVPGLDGKPDGSSAINALWTRSADPQLPGIGATGGMFGTGFGTAGFTPGPDPVLASLDDSGGGGDLFSWLGNLLGLAQGGRVSGPGGSTADAIPAMLSDGEYVINAKQTRKHHRLLDAINADRLEAPRSDDPKRHQQPRNMKDLVAHFAQGGYVGRFAAGGDITLPTIPKAAQASKNLVIHAPVTIHQNLDGAVSPEGIAKIAQSQAVMVGTQFSKQIRKDFPSLMSTALRDKF